MLALPFMHVFNKVKGRISGLCQKSIIIYGVVEHYWTMKKLSIPHFILFSLPPSPPPFLLSFFFSVFWDEVSVVVKTDLENGSSTSSSWGWVVGLKAKLPCPAKEVFWTEGKMSGNQSHINLHKRNIYI